jgi:hypothetical protein
MILMINSRLIIVQIASTLRHKNAQQNNLKNDIVNKFKNLPQYVVK